MKLKLIAAAALLAATGAANAAIDNGAGGNGELFFNIWDGVNSFTSDLNITIDAFQAEIAAAGAINKTFSFLTDSKFTSFIATADLTSLVWNIAATDRLGASRVINTYAGVLGSTRIPSGDGRNMATAVSNFVTLVNTGITAQGGDSAVFAAGSSGYANNPSGTRIGTNNSGFTGLGYSTGGDSSNNSYASGLGMLRVDSAASGISASIYTPFADEGNAVRAYFSGGVLSVAAVPEPETYAMLLAGLGLMGAIARRRRNQA